MRSRSSGVQCADLACELIEIDMVAKDDVTIGITNQEVVAEDFPLSGTVRLGYAHVRRRVQQAIGSPGGAMQSGRYPRRGFSA